MDFIKFFNNQYNWYKNFVIVFSIAFIVFIGFMFFTHQERRNEVYSDYLIKKYLFLQHNIPIEKKNLVNTKLINLSYIAELTNKKNYQESIAFIENNIFTQKNEFDKSLLCFAELIYCHIAIAKNLINATHLENLLLNIENKKHVYILDMHLLKALYLMKKQRWSEAELVLNNIKMLQRQNVKYKYTVISNEVLEACKYHIKKNSI